jgi:hypothetical protein
LCHSLRSNTLVTKDWVRALGSPNVSAMLNWRLVIPRLRGWFMTLPLNKARRLH